MCCTSYIRNLIVVKLINSAHRLSRVYGTLLAYARALGYSIERLIKKSVKTWIRQHSADLLMTGESTSIFDTHLGWMAKVLNLATPKCDLHMCVLVLYQLRKCMEGNQATNRYKTMWVRPMHLCAHLKAIMRVQDGSPWRTSSGIQGPVLRISSLSCEILLNNTYCHPSYYYCCLPQIFEADQMRHCAGCGWPNCAQAQSHISCFQRLSAKAPSHPVVAACVEAHAWCILWLLLAFVYPSNRYPLWHASADMYSKFSYQVAYARSSLALCILLRVLAK